jgi:hypothetical protein
VHKKEITVSGGSFSFTNVKYSENIKIIIPKLEYRTNNN